jgi:MATE family multidrug resistance protein
MSMGVVDTIMVGPLGPSAIGAAGVGTSLHMAFSVFGMGLLLGLDTLVSQAFGARELSQCHKWLLHGIALALALAVPLMLVMFLVLAAIPQLGFHPELVPLLQTYFSIIIWSTPPLLLYAAFRRYLQGVHRPAAVMFALVSANLVNALGNWALVYGHLGAPALGVAGSAWATVLARIYMMIVLFIAIAVGDRHLLSDLRVTIGRIERVSLRRLLELGFPAASTVTLEVGSFAMATALAGQLTPVAVASHQIAMNIAAVCYMIPLGLSSAGAVRVGHAVGARDPSRAAAAGWAAILTGVSVMAATALLFILIPRTLLGVFTTTEEVLLLGTSLLFVGAVFQLFDGLQGVATGALRGLGDTRTPMLWNLAGHWLIGLPVGYSLCFAFGLGAVGLWIGLSVGLMIVGVMLLLAWSRRISDYRRVVALQSV